MLGTKFDVEVIAAGESRVFSFADGAAVFRPGDPGNEAYIVKSGRVEMRERGAPSKFWRQARFSASWL